MYKLENFEIYHLTPSDFDEFQDWVVRLDPFHSDDISPPMKADHFLLLFQICFGCKLPISKVTNLRKRDIDLRQKVVLTKKRGRLVKIPLRDKEYAELQKHLHRMSYAQKLFPITQNTARKYAEDAMIMGGLINPNRAPLNRDATYEIIIPDSRKVNSHLKTEKEKIRQKAIMKDKNKLIATNNKGIMSKHHDVFICHASEDKNAVARPFAEKLTRAEVDVWYDEFSLRWGSKLMKKITEGIQASKIGIVILSPNFFKKKWAQLELDALVELLNVDDGELLPLRYNLTPEDIKKNLPLLSGILSRSWNDGVDDLVLEVKSILKEKDISKTTVKPTKTERIFRDELTQYDISLDKFTEDGNHYVGIRNAKGKTLKSCQILCDAKKCTWWDTHEDYPRHIYEGGAGNVMIPRGFANTNPSITIMSENNKIEQFRLSEISRRPSTKWLAEDENEIKVENLNTAISRIRSNLGTLLSLNQIFLDCPKGFPISDETRQNLSLKNEIVENTQTVTNQASHLLEMDWMNDINDLCILAKNNPWMITGKLQSLQCERCEGIISQIKTILEKLPNPPI